MKSPSSWWESACRRDWELTVPASEDVVKQLGLKKGIRLVGLNSSWS